MNELSELSRILRRIDGRGYKAYRDIAGTYRVGAGQIFIDYVQVDPFAAPTKVRFRLDQDRAKIPGELIEPRVRRIALEDFLARRMDETIHRARPERRGTGKSGLFSIDSGRQEVLERTAAVATRWWVEARLEIGLPAAGRRVLGRKAEEMLCRVLPSLGEKALTWSSSIDARGRDFVLCVENQEAIRQQLEEQRLVAFVAEGSILPRQSGISDRPLEGEGVVLFKSPDSLCVTLDLPNPANPFSEGKRTISGMGIPYGVTLIIGGGYHGKSTLLRALERGVYAHIPGDGREYVVTHPDATKIRAEDRRRVEKTDVSPFIGALPSGQATKAFSTEEASGSTSQAAAIMEAIEAGARVLLMDEDTSATNLMVRDARMQALVKKLHEPITPLVDRIREIYEEAGVSTILVMGGSGDYFDAADTVITMREYHALDSTIEAKKVALEMPNLRVDETKAPFTSVVRRIPLAHSLNPARGRRLVRIDAPAVDAIRFGETTIDLRCVEQLVDRSQTRAIGNALYLASQRFMDRNATVSEILDGVEEFLDREGLDALRDGRSQRSERDSPHPGNFARPRRHEIAAALNRLRTLLVKQRGNSKEVRPD